MNLHSIVGRHFRRRTTFLIRILFKARIFEYHWSPANIEEAAPIPHYCVSIIITLQSRAFFESWFLYHPCRNRIECILLYISAMCRQVRPKSKAFASAVLNTQPVPMLWCGTLPDRIPAVGTGRMAITLATCQGVFAA